MKKYYFLLSWGFLLLAVFPNCNNDDKIHHSPKNDSTKIEVGNNSLTELLDSSGNLIQTNSEKTISNAQYYLLNYGYLSIEGISNTDSISEAMNLPITSHLGSLDSETVDAIKRFQKFVGVSQTGALDSATLRKMDLPRCGVQDLKASLNGETKWNIDQLLYSLAHHGTPVGNLNYTEVLNAIQAAIKIWSDSTFFKFGYSSIGPGDIALMRDVSLSHLGIKAEQIDGTRNTLAYAYFPQGDAFNLGGDIRFDGAEIWSVAWPTPAGSFDLVSVTAHEIGHTLGLGHSSDPTALMYPYYSPHRYLSPDDLRRFHQLYNR